MTKNIQIIDPKLNLPASISILLQYYNYFLKLPNKILKYLNVL